MYFKNLFINEPISWSIDTFLRSNYFFKSNYIFKTKTLVRKILFYLSHISLMCNLMEDSWTVRSLSVFSFGMFFWFMFMKKTSHIYVVGNAIYSSLILYQNLTSGSLNDFLQGEN